MASTTLFGRAKCKRNVAGKVCRCQEWEPSEEDESLCDCCQHHMSFHEPRHSISSGYGKCMQEFDDEGSSHEDGCQEYFPSSCATNSRKCAGCGCHKNYHEKVIIAVGELADPSNVDSQQQDSLSGDYSTALIQPSNKRLKLDPAIISTEVDSEHERPVACGHDQQHEIGVADLRGTTIDDGGRQHEGSVEYGITTDRPHLEPKHKVFLSHSGAQKDFVEQLCIDLERCDRYPFFDKRRSCLPVGTEFPKLLFTAIQQCEVGVVVLSEEFFTKTKWPMLELVEMVRVSKKLEASMNIVPVFLGISREVCRKLDTQEGWISKWKEWAKIDKTINVGEWKAALKIFGSTTGLSLKDGEVHLRKEVVDAVCELVLPESRWDDSNVEGKDRLCKVILDKFGLEAKDPKVEVCIVGLYGMGGIGKTTICKVLCNKLFKEFRGRVCHTELKSASEVALFRGVLNILTDTRHDLLERMNLDKCKDQLKRCIVRQPIFLAIDNVDQESAVQAMTYLREARHIFENGSMVVVTARSLDQLKALNIHEDDCLGMPELELLEARMLFQNYAASIGDVKIKLDECIITRCVQMCRFKKGDGISYHYHPLALKVLGNELRDQMACNKFDPNLWNWTSKTEEAHQLLETKKQIFSILRISYDTLSDEDKLLFMDVALFVPNWFENWFECYNSFDLVGPNLFEWLGMVHGFRNHDVLKSRLEILEKKSLLEKVGDGSTNVGMHDLWREFCVAETKAGRFANRRWVYFGEDCNELGESSPSGSCWENLERMYFIRRAGVEKFLGLHLDHFSNVKVLRVRQALIARIPMVVDLGKMIHLKYLELRNYWEDLRGMTRDPGFVENTTVHGLQSLTNLAFLQWVGMPEEIGYAEEIGCLTNLQFLKLPYCRGNRLPDVSKLTSLRVAFFSESWKVETVIGLNSKLSNLRSLNLANCRNLRSCPGVGDLIGMETLNFAGCPALEELPNLGTLTKLAELYMSGCSSLRVFPGLCGLRHLRKMDISCCLQWRTLPSLSDLVSLEELQAHSCDNLVELPDMRNLTRLEVLNIQGCPIEIMSGFEGLIALRELNASFGLLEDWPALHNLTSLRCVEIDEWNGPGLTSIAKHAMLESLYVFYCKKVNLQLNLRNMERLERLGFYYGELKDVRLAFYDGELKDSSVTNLCQLKVVGVRNCDKLEVLDLINLPRLQKLEVTKCDALKRLTIREPSGALRLIEEISCKRLEEVPDSSNFPGLQKLKLTGCENFTSLTSEKPLPALKRLNLSGCRNLIGLLDLCYFLHLKTLDLRNSTSLTSLKSGVLMLDLEKLDLTGCISLEKLPDMGNFPSLKTFNLRSCERLTRIIIAKPLPALKKLNLRRCRNVKALPDLGYFPRLETLDLRCCESLTSLSCGMPLLALRKLCPDGCSSLESFPDFSNFPNLLKQIFWDRCGSLIRITSEKSLAALKFLTFLRCYSLIALPDLSSFPGLISLDIVDCTSLTSVNSGVPLLALKFLNLRGCIRLEKLADLSNFPSLTYLTLEMCESLLSLTSSEPLLALRSLWLMGCRSLKALPDHLCSSVISYLGVGGSGIVLSEDYISRIRASRTYFTLCTYFPEVGEDSDWMESDDDLSQESDDDLESDASYDDLKSDSSDEDV